MTLHGTAKSPESRTAKWVIYGRNLASKAITVLGSGDFALDLAKISPKIETKPVTTTSTPEHFTFSAGIRSRPKKVRQGSKIHRLQPHRAIW